VQHDLVLEPASALPVKVVDPVGRPLTGVWATGLSPDDSYRPTRLVKGGGAAYHLRPGQPRLMVVHEEAQKLCGTRRLKGGERDEAVVRLGGGGSVCGRLVDADGKPLAGVAVQLYHRERTAEEMHAHVHRARPVRTDAGGRFQIDEVIPGVKFSLWWTR